MERPVVHIGVFRGSDIAREFYERCGLEVIGPARIPTGDIVPFASLEQLCDHIAARPETTHIVVNHGSTADGLLIPFVAGATTNATGRVLAELTALAKDAAFFTLARAHIPPDSRKVMDLKPILKIRPESVVRLAESIAKVRTKARIIHFRGCNIGADAALLAAYKTLFSAAMVTAPKCRMFYQRARPHKPLRGQTMAKLAAGRPATGKTRRRVFEPGSFPSGDPGLAAAGTLILDIRDIDGHTQVDNESFMEHPERAIAWARTIDSEWRLAPRGAGTNSFVVPVMWDNDEASYHVPTDMGYRLKLAFA